MAQKIIIPFLWLLVLQSCTVRKKAELIVFNGRIYTVNDSSKVQQAMAIKAGKILETGSTEFILQNYRSAAKIDLADKTVLPGLIDAHCHFTGYATDMWKCDLTGTDSFEEVIERTMVYAEKAPMYWIYGRGWDQNDWETKDYPDKATLDRLFPDRPVFLKRIDGHAALVNQTALDLAGITKKTKVKGGEVQLKEGELTGLLIDNAMDLVDRIVPPISDSLATAYYLKAQQTCFSYGLTQVQDCGITEHTAQLVDKELEEGRLKIKVFAFLSDEPAYYEKWLKKGVYRNGSFTVGGFKLYADGALGSRGACLLSPYHDKKNWFGFMLRDHNYLADVAQKLVNSNLQLCTHAIGDSANRAMLNIYGRVLQGKSNKRWRIEHAQVVNERDFHLFGDLGVIPSVQPTHATSDMYWAEERLGKERTENAYAYRKLLRSAGILPLGTDFPVEDISPFKTFYAAVSRKDKDNFPEGGFYAGEALSREQALRGMTIWASYAIFEDHKKGSLEKNKAADFIIIDRDIMTCEEKEILQTRVLATFIDGEKVY